MNWEETIRFIRTKPEYKELVEQSYLGENLMRNTERFRASPEFRETLKLIKTFAPNAKNILDVGAGNGISSASFAIEGYRVTATEPDPGVSVGWGAIEILKKEMALSDLTVLKSYGENIPVANESFDLVYIRQAMHHASELDSFVKEAARVLVPGGCLMTIRDHVIFNEKDKRDFLLTHPLQKYYGGENAFTEKEYSAAMEKAGLTIIKKIKYYDSVINYFPLTESEVLNRSALARGNFQNSLIKRFGFWAVIFPFLQILQIVSQIKTGKWSDEKRIPGKMYSFIAVKKGAQ